MDGMMIEWKFITIDANETMKGNDDSFARELPGSSQQRDGIDPDLEHDSHRSRFSRNPLVDKNPSFQKTPDGRFCE